MVKAAIKSRSENKILLRIKELYGNSPPSSIDKIITDLLSEYSDYRRLNHKEFAKKVEKTLASNKMNRKRKHDDDVTKISVSKKAKIADVEENIKILKRQLRHLKRSRVELESDSSVSKSDLLDSSEEEEDDNSEGSNSEEEESKVDLTKLMLRNKYSNRNIVELEFVTNSNNKDTKKLDLMKEDNTQPSPKKPNSLSNDSGFDVANGGKDDGLMFNGLGGMDDLLDELDMEVLVFLMHSESMRNLDVKPMSGILLCGPPGCGKTKLAHAIANEAGVPFYKVSAPELVSGISGASEENIRELFTKAYRTAPSILFIDEIDAIASKRENLQRGMEHRMVTQLMTCMDESHMVDNPGHVLVIGATNRPDALDPALRRPGRFNREITLGVPDENARLKILTVLTRSKKLEGDFDLAKLARATPGFVGTDLVELVDKAGRLAIKRVFDGRKVGLSKENRCWLKKALTPDEVDNFSRTMSDFEVAAKLVQPSTKREGFSSIPNVKWEDVGGLDSLRRVFERNIVERIKYPDEYEEDGADLDTGFLLYGPPGCGKTLIAMAVANEAGANFIHVKGPELLNKYVGESERSVRAIFSRARTCSPCIIFFDEVDSLTTNRGKEGGGVVGLVNQLLIELDGADQRKGVYIIGATNRPEVMDQALLRRGRFGKKLYVPLPNQDERGLILKALAKNKQLDADVDLVAIGQSNACENFSGADLYALMSEAAMTAREERISKIKAATAAAVEGTSGSSSQSFEGGMPRMIKAAHFDQALRNISPSISEKQMQYYQQLQESFK